MKIEKKMFLKEFREMVAWDTLNVYSIFNNSEAIGKTHYMEFFELANKILNQKIKLNTK